MGRNLFGASKPIIANTEPWWDRRRLIQIQFPDHTGAEERSAERTSIVRIEDMAGEFTVTREMLIALCDAVLTKELQPGVLETVGFALMASDRFTWDGEQILGDVIADWSCPEINYPLNVESVRLFRAWLTEENPYPVKPDLPVVRAQVVSVRRKERI
jgi:hypothetical protein